ncbi:MAG: hypothetical protein IKU17_05190, partial [Clostridia bacterium]|nr:hypothetical protein [Clostridia bacterium]
VGTAVALGVGEGAEGVGVGFAVGTGVAEGVVLGAGVVVDFGVGLAVGSGVTVLFGVGETMGSAAEDGTASVSELSESVKLMQALIDNKIRSAKKADKIFSIFFLLSKI